MNEKGSGWIIGAIIIAIIVVAVALLAYFGYLPLGLLGIGSSDDSDMSQPIGSDYCGYAVGDIIGMFENLVGKELNNDVGFTVVNALNMMACGSNSNTPDEIIGSYMIEYADGWYVLDDTTTVRSGYYYRSVLWGNAPLLSNSSLIRGLISGGGVTIEAWYGYNTITVTGYGTRSGYIAFALWLTS